MAAKMAPGVDSCDFQRAPFLLYSHMASSVHELREKMGMTIHRLTPILLD